MILALDTSTPTLRLWLDDQHWDIATDRQLARDLLHIIREKLVQVLSESTGTDHDIFAQLTGIIVYRGPGSFTGLRIGATVANSLASSLHIPIVGTTGSDWHQQGQHLLASGQDHRLVLPLYDRAANVSQPRK
jgi:tRNA threonylcarbamoyladenosine biosynthesis protein TsaB